MAPPNFRFALTNQHTPKYTSGSRARAAAYLLGQGASRAASQIQPRYENRCASRAAELSY